MSSKTLKEYRQDLDNLDVSPNLVEKFLYFINGNMELLMRMYGKNKKPDFNNAGLNQMMYDVVTKCLLSEADVDTVYKFLCQLMEVSELLNGRTLEEDSDDEFAELNRQVVEEDRKKLKAELICLIPKLGIMGNSENRVCGKYVEEDGEEDYVFDVCEDCSFFRRVHMPCDEFSYGCSCKCATCTCGDSCKCENAGVKFECGSCGLFDYEHNEKKE